MGKVGKAVIILAGMILLGCGGGNGDSEAETAGDDIGDGMQGAIDKAENVDALLEENQEAIDKALEDAE